jgi:RNA polymerase sigma factor (sigma-70 family)
MRRGSTPQKGNAPMRRGRIPGRGPDAAEPRTQLHCGSLRRRSSGARRRPRLGVVSRKVLRTFRESGRGDAVGCMTNGRVRVQAAASPRHGQARTSGRSPANTPWVCGHIHGVDEASDDVLWRRISRGDANAFAELFDRHVRRIYGFCFRQTGDWAVAQDLTSITFLEAWRRRLAVVEEGKVSAWLLGIAHNAVRHQHRSLRRYRNALSRLPAPAPHFDHAEDSAERVGAEHQARELLSQLRRLPRAERSVLALIVWEGLTSAEAAVALGIPEATVRTRLHRARRRLSPPDADPPISLEEGIET